MIPFASPGKCLLLKKLSLKKKKICISQYYLLPVRVSRTFGHKQNIYEVNEKVSYGFTIFKFYINWQYLISSYQMKNNASIVKINEPIRFIEAKSCQQISWCIVSKGCISKASTAEVEKGCDFMVLFSGGGDFKVSFI